MSFRIRYLDQMPIYSTQSQLWKNEVGTQMDYTLNLPYSIPSHEFLTFFRQAQPFHATGNLRRKTMAQYEHTGSRATMQFTQPFYGDIIHRGGRPQRPPPIGKLVQWLQAQVSRARTRHRKGESSFLHHHLARKVNTTSSPRRFSKTDRKTLFEIASAVQDVIERHGVQAQWHLAPVERNFHTVTKDQISQRATSLFGRFIAQQYQRKGVK